MSSCGADKILEPKERQGPDPFTCGATNNDIGPSIASPTLSLRKDENEELDGSWSEAHLTWIAQSIPVSVNRQIVTMRSRVLLLHDIGSSDKPGLRHFFLRAAISDGQNRPPQEDSCMWVSYGTIQLLCDKLSLSQQLAPLLCSSFELTDEVDLVPCPGLEDYISYYRTVTSGETTVYIKASDNKVNADHIAIAAGRLSPVPDVLLALHVEWTVVNRGLQCSKGKIHRHGWSFSPLRPFWDE